MLDALISLIIMRVPNFNVGIIYSMHVQLWLHYLDKFGFNDGLFDGELVSKRVAAYDSKIIPLDIASSD